MKVLLLGLNIVKHMHIKNIIWRFKKETLHGQETKQCLGRVTHNIFSKNNRRRCSNFNTAPPSLISDTRCKGVLILTFQSL
jgi:hypothetical protein